MVHSYPTKCQTISENLQAKKLVGTVGYIPTGEVSVVDFKLLVLKIIIFVDNGDKDTSSVRRDS
jgi:hypothetical protein